MTTSSPWHESAMYPSATKFFDPDGMRAQARTFDECGQALDDVGADIPEHLDAGVFGPSLAALVQSAACGVAELVMRMRVGGEQLGGEADLYEATEEANTDTARRVGEQMDGNPLGTAWW